MSEPPSPGALVVGADEQDEVPVDVARWSALAGAVLDEERRSGELTLTFVDRAEIAELNEAHLAHAGPTDVLSFPLDDDLDDHGDVPVLLGDVVICPGVAADQAASHAGMLDDELALLVVHGVLHVLGHDHAGVDEAASMRARELSLLERHHWGGAAPGGFRQEHEVSSS